MKKLAAILLFLLLTALSVPALATGTDGLGDTVARSAELAAFMDGGGNIYVSGLDHPVNTTKADSLVSIDPYRILFFAQADTVTGVPQGRLIALELDGFTETTVTDDAYAACLDGEYIYFIHRQDHTQLLRYDLDNHYLDPVFTAPEELNRIYSSSIGVIAGMVDGAGAYITDPITGAFVPYVGDAAVEIAYGSGFEVYLTEANELVVRPDGALSSVTVDSNVRDWAIIGDDLYYLSVANDILGLKRYNVTNNLCTYVLTPPADMEAQLTASENSLFMLSSKNVIYSVDVANQQLVNFATLPTPQSYALSGTRSITGYRIEAVSGQLNVYGVTEDSSAVPTFTFVDFSAQSPVNDAESNIMLLSAYAIDTESTVWDLLQPAPQYSPLRRGSRGDAVSAIQQPLYDLGYYNYYIDGIFGWRTERAVQLVQADLGLYVNGVADESLQRTILAGGLSPYDPYRALSRGNRGLRVTEMQQRLRDLGYLADDADSIFGARTQAAVELFQSENGLSASGVADANTLRRLYSDTALTCSSYIDLRRGDTGYRVRELNRRLKELYYLDGSAGSTYTAATAEAVRLFQREAGLRQTGQATAAVQRALFSSSAPEYGAYITLRRGDSNSRVLVMQRRLRELGFYYGDLDGYFGRGTYLAVRAFQRQVGLYPTGVADPTTLDWLYSGSAPSYQPPEVLTTPVIYINGVFPTDANGVYLIPRKSVESAWLSFSWTADGVESYEASVIAADGTMFFGMSPVQGSGISFSCETLPNDMVYTLTVLAHPIDKANNRDTSASLQFKIVAEPSIVESVEIRPKNQTYKMEDNVYVFAGEVIGFDWKAYGDAERYSYTVLADGAGDPIASGEDANLTEWEIASNQLTSGTTYLLSVYAFPKGGTLADAVSDSVWFRVQEEPLALPADMDPDIVNYDLPTDEPTEEPTDAPAEEPTDAPTEEPTDAPMEEPTDAPAEEPTDAPLEQPTEIPTEEPTQEPTEAIDSDSTEEPVATEIPDIDEPEAGPSMDEGESGGDNDIAPMSLVEGEPNVQVGSAVGSVTLDVTAPDGSRESAEVVEVGEGTFQLSWVADGDVSGYNVRITNQSGATMVDQNLTNTGASLSSENLTPGEIYTLSATAYFSSGNTASSTLYFMLPAAETSTEEIPASSEEPTAPEQPEGQPGVEDPYAEEPNIAETYAERPYVEEPSVEEPYVEEPYVEEPSVEEPYVEEPYVDEPYVDEPEPTAVPEPEPEPEPAQSYPMNDPSAWTTEVNPGSDPAAIKAIQRRLSEWNWLYDYSSGTLDSATIQAIIDFQTYCNENGVSVAMTSFDNPTIGTDTLRLLFNDRGWNIARP